MNEPRTALLVVDVQNDFCPGGALAVADGNRVVTAINGHLKEAAANRWSVYASRDWHPPVTNHFRAHGGEWPEHCVANTPGAAFHPALELPPSAIVVSKGQAADDPGYSALDGTTPNGRTLRMRLRDDGVTHLYVGGLATDYCVRRSVLDALAAGLHVTVLADAIAGVDVNPGDAERAIAVMKEAGATFRA